MTDEAKRMVEYLRAQATEWGENGFDTVLFALRAVASDIENGAHLQGK